MAFVTTAKEFNDPVNNYYGGGIGNMFPGTGGEVGCTRIISFNLSEAPQSADGITDSSKIASWEIGFLSVGGVVGPRARLEVEPFFNVGPTSTGAHPVVTINTWHSMGISWNFTTGVCQYVYDGTYNPAWYTEDVEPGTQVIDYSALQEWIGTNNSHVEGGYPNYCFSQYWMDDQYLDLSDPLVWAKFFDSNNRPIFLGDNGELPTGTIPLHFAPDANMANNRGTQADWNEVGTVPTCATSPTDGNIPDPPVPPVPGFPIDCQFRVPRGTLYDMRVYISNALNQLCDNINLIVSPGLDDVWAAIEAIELRIDNIAAYLKLDPNILAFGVGVDPTWPIVDGDIPIISTGTTGLNPPTVVGDTIVINSGGLYEISASFGIDIISGNNTVTVRISVNGVPAGIVAGVEFSGGQAAPISQPQAREIQKLDVGDVITFVATELGVDVKLLLWQLSGGSVQQIQHDFANFPPP